MKGLLSVLAVAGAAALLPGCAGTVDYGYGGGYGYYEPSYYNPGYYSYYHERPFESYHFHPLVHPLIRPNLRSPAIVHHDVNPGFHPAVRDAHPGVRREANER